MQPIDDQQLLLLVQLHRLIARVLVDGHGEPLLEVVAAVEHLGQQEIEQSPQLSQIVLKRRAREQQAVVALVLLSEDVGELAFGVLHLVPLVNDDVFPVVFVELEPVLENEVVSSDADVPLGRLHHL